jgi:hypothetical protein
METLFGRDALVRKPTGCEIGRHLSALTPRERQSGHHIHTQRSVQLATISKGGFPGRQKEAIFAGAAVEDCLCTDQFGNRERQFLGRTNGRINGLPCDPDIQAAAAGRKRHLLSIFQPS